MDAIDLKWIHFVVKFAIILIVCAIIIKNVIEIN